MTFLLGVLLGAAIVFTLGAIRNLDPPQPPPSPSFEADETRRRETHNFLHYDGDEQKGA